MITAIRPKPGLRAAAQQTKPKKPTMDPLNLNRGAMSLITDQLREAIEEAVLKQDHGRIILDIRFDQFGIQDFDLLSGIQRNVK